MTLQEWEEEKDRALEEQLTALFQSASPPAPSAGFVSRTVKAARQAPLPEGRHPLRRPWTVPAGWVALIMAAAAATYSALSNQQVVAEAVASLVGVGIRAGLRLVQSVHTSSMVFDLFATTSRVIARALSTREAGAGLLVMALVAAVSLSMLQKLLVSEKETSSW
jgi:hypothetical protein